jgi:hypothetical protein
MALDNSRPVLQRAFYLLPPGSWRDYINLLHAPYSAWHLSYVIIGASLVSRPDYSLLGWTLLSFLLAMGVGAHCFDELRGRPLATTIPTSILCGIAIVSTALAGLIGVEVAISTDLALLWFVAAGVFLVLSYNLEWGPMHHDVVFALAWGAFPVLTSFYAQSGALTSDCILVSLVTAAVSFVQRILSHRVRYLRREVIEAHGYLIESDGTKLALSREWIVRDNDRLLKLLSLLAPAFAVAFLFT